MATPLHRGEDLFTVIQGETSQAMTCGVNITSPPFVFHTKLKKCPRRTSTSWELYFFHVEPLVGAVSRDENLSTQTVKMEFGGRLSFWTQIQNATKVFYLIPYPWSLRPLDFSKSATFGNCDENLFSVVPAATVV